MMLDKRLKIVTAAETLFDQKGFKSTSMQEIAIEAGISKGAVYLHFKSKDELLLAVCESHTNHISSKVKEILNDNSMAPLEKLATQIRFQFEEIQDYQNFYQSLFNDEAIKLNQEFIIYYQEYRVEWQQLQEAFLLSIYGESVRPWIVDLAVCLDGLVTSYLSLAMLEQIKLDIDPLVSWVVRSIDKIASNLESEKPSSVVSADMLSGREEINAKKAELKSKHIEKALTRLIEKSAGLKINLDARNTLEVTLAHLKTQLEAQKQDKVMLRALLAGLRTYRGLSKERQLLAHRLDIELV